jgi:flagellum-specific peptidoglycan hydrolase FlgJ
MRVFILLVITVFVLTSFKKTGVNNNNIKKQSAPELYVKRFYKTAIEESILFGIPASITLAQGILESNSGRSRMVLRERNHFGIKCSSITIKTCKCANYNDDSPSDMFRVFKTDWESYREHSKLLSTDRYKHLKKIPAREYKRWTKGLLRAGYATNQKYDKILNNIIEVYHLRKYDNWYYRYLIKIELRKKLIIK